MSRLCDDDQIVDDLTWHLLYRFANPSMLQHEWRWKFVRNFNICKITSLSQIIKKLLNISVISVVRGETWKCGQVHLKNLQNLETHYLTLKADTSPNLHKEPPTLLHTPTPPTPYPSPYHRLSHSAPSVPKLCYIKLYAIVSSLNRIIYLDEASKLMCALIVIL